MIERVTASYLQLGGLSNKKIQKNVLTSSEFSDNILTAKRVLVETGSKCSVLPARMIAGKEIRPGK
jgi:hypothetical protein